MVDLGEQIDQMLGDYTSGKKKEEINEVEEVEEVEEGEVPEDEEETVEEESEEEEEADREREEVEEEEPESESKSEVVEDEEDEEEDQLAALRAEIDAKNKLLLEHGIATTREPQTSVEQSGGLETPQVKTPIGTLEILGEDESLDDVLNDRQNFERWAQGFAQRIIQSGSQQYLTRLPSVVAPQVRQIIDLNRAVDEFYKNNEDLLPVRSTVGAIGRELAQKNPGWSLPELFNEAGKQAEKF